MNERTIREQMNDNEDTFFGKNGANLQYEDWIRIRTLGMKDFVQNILWLKDVRFKLHTDSKKMESKLVRVYTGSSILINLLKDELENNGIAALIQDDFNSGIIAGFSGGIPTSVDLFIRQDDLEKAETIISEFARTNQWFHFYIENLSPRNK